MLFALAPPAAADHLPFPDNAAVGYPAMLADNAEHTWCRATAFTIDQIAGVLWAMSNLDSQTDMFDNETVCGATTDVYFWEIEIGGGVRGQWFCVNDVGTAMERCDTGNVDLDFAEIDEGDDDIEDRAKTTVHEVGHSVGLGHTELGAMIEGEIPDTSSEWRMYDAHDVDEIDLAY